MKWLRLAEPDQSVHLARAPGGALFVRLAGTTAALRPSGALWLPGSRSLVAGDLHLEKGSSYAARGQLLPPYDTRATLERLAAEVRALTPHLIVLLGDSFHDAQAPNRLAAVDRALIIELAEQSDLVWVAGNHDARAPIEAALPGRSAAELDVEGLTLRHEPREGAAAAEVSGHLHPCARVAGRGAGLRRRAFLTDGERLILPAFGAYAGGLNACDPAFSGLFRSAPLAGVLGRDAVHPIPYSSLRAD